MKKSIMLFLAVGSAIAFLVAPGIALADDCPAGAYCPVMAYRSIDNPSSWTAALGNLGSYIVVLPATTSEIWHPTNATQPGYVGGPYNVPSNTPPPIQWTYVIDFPSPLGGNLWNVENRVPGDCTALAGGCQGVGGELVFSNYYFANPSQLPSTSLWNTQTFLSNVEGVTLFNTGCSSVVTFEHDGQSVPEPGAWLLLGCGLISVAGMRRVVKSC